MQSLLEENVTLLEKQLRQAQERLGIMYLCEFHPSVGAWGGCDGVISCRHVHVP